MNIECTLSLLHREGILLDHAPHSTQFRNLTTCLLGAFSAAGAIPALSAQDARLYSSPAPLHDVGKRAIPSEILNKPGRLTREEFEVMKTHTVQGCELLERIPALKRSEVFPLICDVCRHHERWDGTGYPDRLAGRDIAPWVQVVGLADAFDALLHPRVYKPAFPMGQAVDMIVGGACGHLIRSCCCASGRASVTSAVLSMPERDKNGLEQPQAPHTPYTAPSRLGRPSPKRPKAWQWVVLTAPRQIWHWPQASTGKGCLPVRLCYGADNIGGYGCDPTSMAIVISSLTDEIVDPVEMAKWTYEHSGWCKGQGSYHSFIPMVVC